MASAYAAGGASWRIRRGSRCPGQTTFPRQNVVGDFAWASAPPSSGEGLSECKGYVQIQPWTPWISGLALRLVEGIRNMGDGECKTNGDLHVSRDPSR